MHDQYLIDVGLITWELHVLDLVGLYDGIVGFNEYLMGYYKSVRYEWDLMGFILILTCLMVLYRFILPVCNAGMTERLSTAHRGCRDWLSKPQ